MKSLVLIVVIASCAFAANIPKNQSMGYDLIDALWSRNETEALKLIEEGADANVRSPGGLYPMHIAAIMGQDEAIKLLIEKGYKYQMYSEALSRTPLIEAVDYDNDSTVELLIKMGSDVNAVQTLALTNPLRTAVKQNNKKIVKLLLKHGADIHAEDHNGSTALSIANYMGFNDIARFLEAWELIREQSQDIDLLKANMN